MFFRFNHNPRSDCRPNLVGMRRQDDGDVVLLMFDMLMSELKGVRRIREWELIGDDGLVIAFGQCEPPATRKPTDGGFCVQIPLCMPFPINRKERRSFFMWRKA